MKISRLAIGNKKRKKNVIHPFPVVKKMHAPKSNTDERGDCRIEKARAFASPLTHAACSSRVEHHHLSGSHSRGSLNLLGTVRVLRLGGLEIIVSLVRAVDGNLDRDLAALDLLSVHLRDSLLLQLLRGQRDEAEAAALAGLAASLELLDHKPRNGPQGDLGRQGLIGVEQLLELRRVSVIVTAEQRGEGLTDLLLGQVIREVSDHDLGLGGDTVGRGAALPTLPRTSLGLARLAILVTSSFVSDVLESLGLCGSSRIIGFSSTLFLLLVL